MTTTRLTTRPNGVLLVALLVALGACSSNDLEASSCDVPAGFGVGVGEAAPVGASSFIAFAQHFAGYHAWPSTPGVTKYPATEFHVAGSTTVYINRKPATGATEFPVGTIVVKETNTGPLNERTAFAMVKRGAGYNASGAAGWEWFELKPQCGKDEPAIGWRGVGPPTGESYGGDATGCNNCHALAADNDFVLTAGLSFAP